jgi:CspA family cold shock protein
MPKQEKHQGTVIWFSLIKGFGFIRRDDGKDDIFVHYTEIQTVGFKTLLADQRVEFIEEEGRQGLQASHVRILEPEG